MNTKKLAGVSWLLLLLVAGCGPSASPAVDGSTPTQPATVPPTVTSPATASPSASPEPLTATTTPAPETLTPAMEPPPATSEPSLAPGRAKVAGLLTIVTGDPISNGSISATAGPAYGYSLKDSQGKKWTLLFDREVYWPPGSPLAFSRREVVVEGKLVRSNRILVDSIRLK